MQHTIKKLEKSELEITITVTPEEYQPQMEDAANRLSERTIVKGFRKGKVPYEQMKREAGEMAILQEALESIIQKTFYTVVKEQKLETIGMPKIDANKTAPGNDLIYSATVAILPEVKLPELTEIKVEKKEAIVDPKKLDETLDSLRGMQAKETIKKGKAEGTDKLVIDMDMLIDNVPVEGGQAKDYQVHLSEDHYIPGFNEKVVGMEEGEEREFSLGFPKEHYQKHLAGKTVDFKVKAKGVYTRELPELDEEFAKKLGQDSVEKLKEIINNNMLAEAKQKVDQKIEIGILEGLIEKTNFGELPEVLIDSERQKMFYELKRDLDRNGVSIEKYLEDIKKDEKELYEDFRTQAEKRAKAALISRQVAKEQGINISPEALAKEIDLLKKAYPDDKQTQENLERPEVQESIATTMQNRQVMQYLKEKILGEVPSNKSTKETPESK
ncbi:trigger factor [Patescibacteria group bacterium]|nr:trigger factor [Patescibacteria group bacterium]MBU1895859.1 trigger factor [Patescibacteria group bacterium]